ncbi:MAG: AMP-binding protein [Bacteroidia bacterium]|nr:AMP-binding protein [Bacteroidia bacterium]
MKFIYDNQRYALSEICSLETEDQWLIDIQSFLREWTNDSNEIVVNTSGSTGIPKQIQLSKNAIKTSAGITIDYFCLRPAMTLLLCLPVRFIAGKLMIIRALESNSDLILKMPSSNPLETLETKIDFAAMTPFQVSKTLIQTPEKLNLISTLLLGGGGISQSQRKALHSLTSTQCYLSYGMTETITHVAIQKISKPTLKPIFKVLDGFQIAQDERSCLVIEADHIYQKKVVTNDIVEMVDSDRFIWKGRWDNIINSGGIKISPEEVETKIEMLINIPFFIYWIPDEELGQKIVLFIKNKRRNSEEEVVLLSKLKKTLNKYEMPRSILYLDCFDYTDTGKIRRQHTFQKYFKHA